MRSAGAAKFWMNHPPAIEPFRLRRVPMLAAALCFAAGDLCARRWHGPMLLATATASLFFLALFSLYRAPRVAIVPALAFWMSLGCWCAQIQPPVDTQQALAHYADGLSRTVRGRVVHIRTIALQPEGSETPQGSDDARPGTSADDKPGVSVDLDLQAIEEVTPDVSTMQPVKGGIRVTLFGDAIPLRCGDVLEIPLRLRMPEVYRDPGAWSYRDQLLGEGIGVLGTQRSERVHLTHHEASDLHCRFMAAQSWASQRLQTFVTSSANMHLPAFLRLRGDDVAMLNSMLFGDRSELNRSLRDGLERTGTFHLFVVSGDRKSVV